MQYCRTWLQGQYATALCNIAMPCEQIMSQQLQARVAGGICNVMMQHCISLSYILPKRPFLTERSLTFSSISVIRSEISLRLSSNFMNCFIAADNLSSVTSVLKEAQGKEAVAPCFEELGNIFTESIQRNMIQNYLIYSISALYNTKLAELNSSVKAY